jgi:3'-phosphoadenosine 5'-phosphosulfate (PAPS) 3'-phosphatase
MCLATIVLCADIYLYRYAPTLLLYVCQNTYPIDGTRSYLALRQYCIALALTDDGTPRVEVLGWPNLPVHSDPVVTSEADPSDTHVGVVFHAVTGRGSYWMCDSDAADLIVSAASSMPGVRSYTSSLADATSAVFCESVEVKHSSHELLLAWRLFLA